MLDAIPPGSLVFASQRFRFAAASAAARPKGTTPRPSGTPRTHLRKLGETLPTFRVIQPLALSPQTRR